ncbi:MAG: hypothetical protein U9P73_07635 [Candidatus Cloacimonadota bacterium]|nr:hypothetical protein [Candidatus Cloacimonadota bacterium]
MKNKFWILFLLVIVFFSFWACSQKDPIGIEQVLMDDPDGHAPVLTNVQSYGDSIWIEWFDNVPENSEFHVYRQLEENAFSQIAVIDSIYFEYFDTYEFTDSTNVTYYVETYTAGLSQQSNQLEIIVEP